METLSALQLAFCVGFIRSHRPHLVPMLQALSSEHTKACRVGGPVGSPPPREPWAAPLPHHRKWKVTHPNFLHCAKRLEVTSLLALQGPSPKLHPFPANKCIPSERMPPNSLKSIGMKCLSVHKSFKPTKISPQSP